MTSSLCVDMIAVWWFVEMQNAIAADASDEVAVTSRELRGSQDGREVTDDDDDDDDDDESEVVDMSGMKCRVPFTHSWGEMSFHNAMILCVLPDQSQVLVTHPMLCHVGLVLGLC